MKLKDIYALAIKMGMAADPRSPKELKAILEERAKQYEKMEKDKKQYFDKDALHNPYYDSRVLYANSLEDDIKTVMVGIDMEPSELLLAATLKERGIKVDLVLAHHPEGAALLGLGNEMLLQNTVMEDCGLPINVAEKVLAPRKTEVDRSVHATNFIRPLHTAELLKINYACFHTITDNLVYHYIKKKMGKKQYRTVNDVVNDLMKEPEYQMASRLNNPPIVVTGSKDSRAGRVAPTEFTGGTSGHEDIYEKLALAGVGTVISMHMTEKHRKEAEKHHLNVIVAGHMASDSLGMNLFLDALEKHKIRIIPCGMFRVKR